MGPMEIQRAHLPYIAHRSDPLTTDASSSCPVVTLAPSSPPLPLLLILVAPVPRSNSERSRRIPGAAAQRGLHLSIPMVEGER